MKLSSTTHWINGSQLIAQGSFTPRCWLISASDSSVAAGTMRSTMVPGKLTCSFIHPASSGEHFSAIPSTAFFTTWPLSGILSQESTVNGVRPRSRRRFSASTRIPGAE
ncbi:Uncharacterised protein [Shigella sonnei]|nr:Uncharacterised protein [Shigella sonnei]